MRFRQVLIAGEVALTVVLLDASGLLIRTLIHLETLPPGFNATGLMTARGAADFLTRSTAVLGGLFIVLSIVMAAIAGATRQPVKIDTSIGGADAAYQAVLAALRMQV